MLVFAAAARASCDTGAPPKYRDITYVKVAQAALVGMQHPWYTYEAAYYGIAHRASVSLDAHRGIRLAGSFVSASPLASFESIVQVLKKDRFFALRLHPARALYIDGPEDSVTVVRCGVTTTLSSVPLSEEVNLGDAQAKTFGALLDDLRAAILKQNWETPPAQTP